MISEVSLRLWWRHLADRRRVQPPRRGGVFVWTITPTIPPSFPGLGMIGQRPERRPSMGRSTVRSLLLRTKISLPASTIRASPPCRISTFCAGISSLIDVTLAILTTLGSDHLPITVSLSSHAPALAAESVFFRERLTGRDLQPSQKGASLSHLCLPPALLGKKSSGGFSATQEDAPIPCGYVRDYCSHLPDVERPLISERDQRLTGLHLLHLGEHGLTFLTELFNL